MLPPSTLPPLSLYIHLPWCVQKCPYCDFNSHQWRGEDWQVAERGYLMALKQDLQNALPQVWGRRLISIFIGGGTPSLFSPEAIFDLVSTLRSLFAFSPQIEVTMEANPNSAEVARFAAWRDAGINRLSIGIQSFNPTFLERLGRAHGRREALLAAEQANRHFSNFNLDLMYALPGQRPEDQLEDLETALSFQPPHLSCYQLTIEAQTAFAKAPPPDLPNEDESYQMEEALQQRLQAVGYQRYEISAYSRGQRCQHNLNYWQFGDYLGVGAGAHSKLTCWEGGQWRVERQIRLKHPYRYMEALAAAKTAIDQSETVGEDALVFEFMLNALRLPEGFASSAFRDHTGLDLTLAASALARATEQGLLERSPQWIRPTPLGLRFLNDLQTLFLPSPQRRGRRAIPIQPVA